MSLRLSHLKFWLIAAVTVGTMVWLVHARRGDPFSLEAQQYLEKQLGEWPYLKRKIQQFVLPSPALAQRDFELASLGRKLFFDNRLSANGQVACSSCHQPGRSFTDGLRTATGIGPIALNTPTILNTFANFWFFWDGRADSLAAQAIAPLENPKEHGLSRSRLAQLIVTYYAEDYVRLFGEIPRVSHIPEFAQPPELQQAPSDELLRMAISSLGSPELIIRLNQSARRNQRPILDEFRSLAVPTPNHQVSANQAYLELSAEERRQLDQVAANTMLAIEAYERGLVANESPFDAFVGSWLASDDALPTKMYGPKFGAQEFLGLMIFAGKAQCTSCHTNGNFTDNQFHNIGLPPIGEQLALGRSLGILRVINDPFNCNGLYASISERQSAESCKDLKYLDPNTPEGIGAFKTPTLRNVAETGPYMHDGRFQSLRQVIEHYNVMDTVSAVGFREETLRPLRLDEVELRALEKFLRSLSSPVRDLTFTESVH